MKRLLTSLSISLVLSLGLVFAHSEFESSVPEDGAVLDTPPTEVVINFEKDIQPTFSIFKVYPLPAEMIAEAATIAESEPSGGEAHSEGGEQSDSAGHSESATQAEAEHTEGETHSGEDDQAHSEAEHSESEEHSVMDAAAKLFIPRVIDLTGDEDARADTGIAPSEDMAKSVTINLKENLAPGAYVAMFRVLSADTHTVEGFITFEIKE
jgi:methionine-rich copper-binding protein CopC